MQTTTLGVFKDRTSAETAINELRTQGIADTDISYVYSDPESTHTKTIVEDGSGTHAGSGAASGMATGAVLGAIAGLVVANGILPGLGTLFVAGPIAGALGLTGAAATAAAGAMTGLAAGGLVGALGGLGVSAEEAHVYEEKVKLGGILVTATSTNSLAVKETFKKCGADEIREYSRG